MSTTQYAPRPDAREAILSAPPTTAARTSIALRIALLANALVAATGLVIKVGEAATTADPQLPTVFGRVANELCYFTIQSNIVVVAVCLALAWSPAEQSALGRWVAGVPRLIALVCISVTAVVYYALLAGDEHSVGIAKVGDVLAHAVSPALYVGTWLVLGPRGFLRRPHAAQMLVYPLAWIALTLVRGAIIHVYPYDFVDVAAKGYVPVVITIAALTAAAGALALGAVSLDRRVTARYSIVP